MRSEVPSREREKKEEPPKVREEVLTNSGEDTHEN